MSKDATPQSKAVEEAVANLMRRIDEIKPGFDIHIEHSTGVTAEHFSDWHDRFKDGGTFHDGFGKAGG